MYDYSQHKRDLSSVASKFLAASQAQRQAFLRHFSYQGNFMTPERVAIVALPGLRLAELSFGKGFGEYPIFGVTIIQLSSAEGHPSATLNDLCKSLQSASDVADYLESLCVE